MSSIAENKLICLQTLAQTNKAFQTVTMLKPTGHKLRKGYTAVQYNI